MPHTPPFIDTEDFLDELEMEDTPDLPEPQEPTQNDQHPRNQPTRQQITPGQKLLLSGLFFLVVLIFGIFIMLITETMVLP